MNQSTIIFGKNRLQIEDIISIVKQESNVALNSNVDYRNNIEKANQFLDNLLAKDGVIYGVTTGYGDSCTVSVPKDLVPELPLNLVRYHGCGLGKTLDKKSARAVLAVRLCSLSQGYSGVSWTLLNKIVEFINHDIIPIIPEEGSVGASGDLTPLSYLAATLIGEREVLYKNEKYNTSDILKKLNIQPIKLKPKEGLAIMNGTAVMTGIACLAYDRAEYLTKLAARLTAFVSWSSNGNSHHFDEILFSVKPHPGQIQIAQWIRNDLNQHDHSRNSKRLQDRYSIRCAPHVIGCLNDALPWIKTLIENELNSANDNPIIDGENEYVLHGGHFYGGHIAMAMDTLKTCIANIADLVDRQMALLMDTKFNHGLPANLTGNNTRTVAISHGFKAVQIAISAWTAEALKLTMPASVFSRSTECHNQDKVSMGTISARDCIRVLELTEQVVAAGLLAVTQATYIRIRDDGKSLAECSVDMLAMYNDIVGSFNPVIEDRALDKDIKNMIKKIKEQHWKLFE